ncbi:2TM domain-containing protein [Oceanihabitans sp. 2_MG-2023]|uniref:2TM domain-containing protein n=1 Tax=Oceanihabitans sp. 2_MG-2023 TaxID=3062661 RepID=UPI0026E23CCD|nr:2TM domain-containing protein [Oceanihabitans sp. 2_MG-2023]MDO6597099.1 2TM domain-containing protein [Oceanihabitans sp. 2_MG-2023]
MKQTQHIESYNNNQFSKEEAYLKAKKRVGQIKGFYWHLLSYIVINIVILYMISLNVERENFWTFNVFSTVFYWGIGLFFHFLGVFGRNVFLGKAWEERKIKKILEKEEQQQNWQ